MIRRSILSLVAVAAFAVPAAASADPSVNRVSIAPQATFVSTQQINVELGLSCPEGLFYNAGASVLQQQGPTTQVFGSGSVSGQCTGRSQKIAVPVFSFSFPGWQLGPAITQVFGCSFSCDNTSREIRITL
jgi:hypothetical protein